VGITEICNEFLGDTKVLLRPDESYYSEKAWETIKKELITQRDPKSPVSEVFRTLRTNITVLKTQRCTSTRQADCTTPRTNMTHAE
jgi:hypothetical protein